MNRFSLTKRTLPKLKRSSVVETRHQGFIINLLSLFSLFF